MRSIDEVVLAYLEAIDSPKALSVWLCYKYDQPELLRLTIDPLDYADRVSFHKDYLAIKFLSKYDSLAAGVDRPAVALDAFSHFERLADESNRRLIKFQPSGDVSAVFRCAVEKIGSLLPPVDSTVIEEVTSLSQFGPGVTSSCKGKWLSPFEKIPARGDITPRLRRVLEPLANALGAPSILENLSEIRGNTVATVPKNSKTDRTIAVEPHINSFFQRGVGIFLRSSLRKWKVNLHDQTKNQDLARIGSETGAYATIDLSGASDTVSVEIVRSLLPDDWVQLLECLRSPEYQLRGEWHRYAKHSSMGNGYTFELETLIFSALLLGTYTYLGIRSDWAVYGDDIVIDTRAVRLFEEVLQFAGFVPNTSKTFTSSYFRESCGSDWWDGTQVTPFYFKKGGDVVQLISFANWLRAESPPWLPISKVWKAAYFLTPRAWANRGPRGSDYLNFWVNWWEVDPSAQILWRRPYGPVIGIKAAGMHFTSSTRAIGDTDSAVKGSLYLLSKRPGSPVWKHTGALDVVRGAEIRPYERLSTARELGRWVRRSFVFTDEWPMVRVI